MLYLSLCFNPSFLKKTLSSYCGTVCCGSFVLFQVSFICIRIYNYKSDASFTRFVRADIYCVYSGIQSIDSTGLVRGLSMVSTALDPLSKYKVSGTLDKLYNYTYIIFLLSHANYFS